MRTQVMHERALDLPWLEQCPADGGLPQRTVLDSFPFLIGRDENLNLTIPSKRVSRQHATILETDDGYLVRDLDSTNGTFLNGAQIEEALLSDGDVLVFADLEFTFFAGKHLDSRDMATQVIQRASPGTTPPFAWEVVRTVRRLEETLVDRAIDVHFHPVVRLADHSVAGMEAHGDWQLRTPQLAGSDESVYATDCRLTARLRQLRRRIAADAIRQVPEGTDLFLEVDDSEIGDPRLAQSLVRLRQPLGESRRLVIVLPAGVFDGAGNIQEFSSQLRGSGLLLACVAQSHHRFSSPPQGEIWPDFLKLSLETLRDLQRTPDRQRLFQQMLRSCQQHHCEVIATGLETIEEALLCRQLGCTLGGGPLFATPAATAMG